MRVTLAAVNRRTALDLNALSVKALAVSRPFGYLQPMLGKSPLEHSRAPISPHLVESVSPIFTGAVPGPPVRVLHTQPTSHHGFARIGLPGYASAISSPSRTTAVPATSRWRTPIDGDVGAKGVAVSVIVVGSITTMSASAPTRRWPFVRAEAAKSSIRAGRKEHLRKASSQDHCPVSLTIIRRDLAYVPAVRG